jgi:hypothetical protein
MSVHSSKRSCIVTLLKSSAARHFEHRAASALQAEGGDEDDEHINLASLAGHKLRWNPNDGVANPHKRRDDVEDYKVVDPLLEAGRAAFDKNQQKANKRLNAWAGGANM